MVETITAAASPALDHIIERPRLIAHLEEDGGARVTVFAAPAGYGKTTLARQWSARQMGPVAWYRTTRASGDVALLAVQLDDLLASVATDLPREPLKVASIASVNPSPKPLGRAIVQSFEPLTRDVLLVVDEWESAGTDEAEELLSMLVDGLDIRFLVTSRSRPDWFAPRLEVYGEGLELGLEELAMTDEEAAEVLATGGAVAGRARLMRTADGWPAVLGLAAMSKEIDFGSSRLLSHTLYEFLASELLAAAAPETQDALMLLAAASVMDLPVAQLVLGDGGGEAMREATARGLLAVTDERSLLLHPLMKELLVRRFREADEAVRADLLSKCRRLLDARRWDEALAIGEVSGDRAFITEALGLALDDLLDADRTSSLDRWIVAARAAGVEGGLIDYAESELRLRRGELDHALALGAQAAQSLEGDLAARAHLVASRAALLNDRPKQTEIHAEAAAATAETAATLEDALWLRFAAAWERQTPDLRERLADFESAARPGVKQTLMSANGQLILAAIEGGLGEAIDAAGAALAVTTGSSDAIAHTALLGAYSYALSVACRYEDGFRAAEALLALAEGYGFDFPLGYARLYRVVACVGLRRFPAAGRELSALERETRDAMDGYFGVNLPIQRARLYASLGDLRRAADALSAGPSAHSSLAAQSESLGWQALLGAITGEDEAAAEDSRSAGRSIQARALFLMAQAVVAHRERRSDAADVLIDEALATGAWDPILITVRADRGIAARIAQRRETRLWLRRLLERSTDTSLAASLGLRVPRAAKRTEVLSPREREVYDLIAQGLTNEEIAKLLFISLSTTKVHVKHILGKLGVRSRIEAARAWQPDEPN